MMNFEYSQKVTELQARVDVSAIKNAGATAAYFIFPKQHDIAAERQNKEELK